MGIPVQCARGSLRRSALLLITLFGLLSGCASVPAQYRTSRLSLQKSGLAPLKYSFDGSRPANVMGWVTYNPAFLEVLSQQPAALAEARQAVPYHYASTGVMVVGTAYTFSELAAAYGASSNGNTLGDIGRATAHQERALAALLLTTVGVFVLAIPAGSHLMSALDLFNAGLEAPRPEAVEPQFGSTGMVILPNTLQLDPAGQRVAIGWKLQTPSGW